MGIYCRLFQITAHEAEQIRTDPEAVAPALADAGRRVQAALDEIRDLAHGIYPSALSDLGPAYALADVARAIVRDCPDLARVGVQVMEIAKLVLNLSDEDQKRIDQYQDQIVQAKIDGPVAQ